jgi:two-component system, NarL family, sensor histidine kinase BarA
MSKSFGVHHDTGVGGPTVPGKLRILLADDAVAARVLTSALLRRMGFEVDVADGGEAALALAGRTHYDLFLLDLDMPGMDGIATARKLRMQSGGDWSVPIIALSAYLGDQTMANDRRQLFDGAVAKPVQGPMLQRAIADALDANRARATPPGVAKPADIGPAAVGPAHGSEPPLVDLAALEAKSAGARAGAWKETIDTMVAELRQAALRMEAAAARHDGAAMVRCCADLARISGTAAPRLAERAAGFAAASRQHPDGELARDLAAPAGEVIGCAVATVGKLNKLAAWR